MKRLFQIASVLGVFIVSATVMAVATNKWIGKGVLQSSSTAPTCATATGAGDLCVADAIECNGALDVAGAATLRGNVTIAGTLDVTGVTTLAGVPTSYTMADDAQLTMGTGSDSVLTFDNAVQVPDSLMLTTGTDSNQLVICETADLDTDLTIAQQTNPTIVVRSADKADALDYITVAHNQTNGVIGVGQGLVSMPSGTLITDDKYANFGASSDAGIGYNASQTPDALFIGVGQDSRTVVIGEYADIANDYAIAQQTNPTLVVHSAAATAAQYMSFAHDQTDGRISTAAGDLLIDPAGGDTVVGGNLKSTGGLVTPAIEENLVAGACTAGKWRVDNTGTRELCRCNDAGTAYDCISVTAINGPTD